MNERMLELYKLAQVQHTAIDPSNNMPYETTIFSAEKFAELILQEHVELLKQRWYTLNNIKPPSDESSRDIGMRVGQKIEVQQCIRLLLNHWKDRIDDSTEERQQDSRDSKARTQSVA